MGFRFRKSVKLFPGVRMNLGLRGASLSVGGRGATMNFSSRGARATFGIPGTGLSFTSSSGAGGGRRRAAPAALPSGPTRAELAASKRAVAEMRRAEAAAEEAADAAQRADIVNRWRDLPAVPPWEAYLAGTRPRAFQPASPPPQPPSEVAMRLRHEGDLREATRRAFFPTSLVLAWTVGVVALALAGALAGPAGALGVGAMAIFAHVVLSRQRRERIEVQLRATLATSWPAQWDRIVAAHNEQARDYAAAVMAHHQAWMREEGARAQWASRLVQGDVEALTEAISDSVADLDFPFETHCRTGVFDPTRAALLVDLPEIEDVIPETRVQALKNGTTRNAKRTKAERNREYAELVTGLGIMLARAAFAAAPTVQTISVAGFTQRRRRGSGVLADEYVFELTLGRAETAALTSEVDPLRFVLSTTSRVLPSDNGDLKRIDPPPWAAELAS